mgnify:CR=1 FL=1
MIKKLLINSTLLLVLFILIGTPMSSMLLTKLKEEKPNSVLSSQDAREKNEIPEDLAKQTGLPAVAEQDEAKADVPKNIEEFIRKLEEEFYQTTESTQQVEPDTLLP